MAMGLKGRWCPQNGGRWWHWVGSDIGGIGVGGMLVSPKYGMLVALGLEVMLVALGLKEHWCPQSGGRWWHWD